jgi:DNA-binding NarL/FixJ family response regulator
MTTARILIVEDEPILAADIEQLLQAMGHTVVAMADNGGDAIRLAAEAAPEVILMDINIRGPLNGIETARRLRDSGKDVPVIFLTSYSDAGTVERAREAEPSGYLLKPFEEPLIRITVEMALYKHRMEKEREAMRRELAAAQEEIQTLSGLLPICAHCKKIKNDKGTWEQIEAYIARHSEAQFTHGICMECLTEHHPEFAAKLAAKREAP